MASLNKVTLIGNLGRDPEIRYMPDGTPVASVSLATSEVWKDRDGERQESTEWHRLVFFRGLAKVIEEYLVKGSTIYVEGKLKTRKWQDKEGKDQSSTEIHVRELLMLGGKRKNEGSEGPAGQRFQDDLGDDDVPY